MRVADCHCDPLSLGMWRYFFPIVCAGGGAAGVCMSFNQSGTSAAVAMFGP